MGEGGRALERLREVAGSLLLVAEEIGADERQLKEFRTQLNRCELAFSLATRPLARRCREDEAFEDLSPYQILRHDCNMASGPAAAAVEVGQMLDVLPQSREALEAGRIGLAHLNLISYTADAVAEGFNEDEVLEQAEKLPVTAFARFCTRYRHQLDPEGLAEDERRRRWERFLEVTTNWDDGCVWLRGFFDAETGACIRTAIEGMAQPLPNDDRTPGQRRADALAEIARLSLDEGRAPSVNGVRPHLQITATLETLLAMPGAPPAELERAGPISLEMLRRLSADCSIRRLLLDEHGMVIDVGRERRLFRGATRLAIEHRDRGCVWRGCTRAARYCQTDHIQPWWEGGQTVKSNGRLLCLYHHHLLDDGWELTRTEEGWIPRPPLWAMGRLE